MKKVNLLIILMLSLLVCKGQSLLEEGKVWSNTSIGTMRGSTYSSYFIKFKGDTVLNGLGYKKIMRSDDELHSIWTVKGFIREELATQKVFVFNGTTRKDRLIYDFSLKEGDSILTGEGQPYIKVKKIINAPFGNSSVIRKQICFFDSNASPFWIEGIGSVLGVLEGINSIYTTGAYKQLVCYYENEQLVYHNPEFSTCFPKGPKVSILDASLKWNIGTHCVKEEPIDPYDKWSTAFLHIEGDTLMNNKRYKKLVSCADSLCKKESLKSYIREEYGKIFLANKTEEINYCDFNLQKGDTMILKLFKLGDIIPQYFIHIDSIKALKWPDQKERIAQYVTLFDYKYRGYSIHDVFVEGIGSLTFGLEYPRNLFITGDQWCDPALLCFHSGEELIYSNPKINNCYLNSNEMKPEFAPIGAEWYYSQPVSYNPPMANYIKQTCIKDSIIAGRKVKVIQKTKFKYGGVPVNLGYEYLHQHGDTIFYWKSGAFHELYNFSLSKGDSIKLYSEMPNRCEQNTRYGWNNVDSVYSISINNHFLKAYSTTAKKWSIWGFDSFPIIEKIGSLQYLLPQNSFCGIMDGIPQFGLLRCYSDPELGMVHFGNIPCDRITTYPDGVLRIDKIVNVKIYPNPVSDKLQIEGNIPEKGYGLELYSVTGELVKTECIDSGANIYRMDVRSLKSGIYILHLVSASGKYTEEVIIKK